MSTLGLCDNTRIAKMIIILLNIEIIIAHYNYSANLETNCATTNYHVK